MEAQSATRFVGTTVTFAGKRRFWIGPVVVGRLEGWQGLKPKVEVVRWLRSVTISGLGLFVSVSWH